MTCTPAQGTEVDKAPGSEKLKRGIKLYSVIFANCAPGTA